MKMNIINVLILATAMFVVAPALMAAESQADTTGKTKGADPQASR